MMFFAKIPVIAAGLGTICITTSMIASEISQTPNIPPNCQMLTEVSTGETHITKQIQNLGITNNFNTDFDIPAGVTFSSYRAMIEVENNAKYDVTLNLKYGDNSVSTVYQKKQMPMMIGEQYSLPFETPIDKQPYQLNFNIAGPNNTTYTISAMACQ